MLARLIFIRTFSADFRIFLRYVFFHFRPFSLFSLVSVPGPFQVISHLPLPPIIPLSPGHIPSFSLSLYHTHINTHLTKNQKQSLVCFPVNHSLVFSLWILRGEEGGGVWRRRSGFVTVVPGDSEGSAGSNLGSDPLSSPWRPPH